MTVLSYMPMLATGWLALLYAYAGTFKIGGTTTPRPDDARSMLPPMIGRHLVWVLPSIEISIASLLSLGVAYRVGSLLSLAFSLGVIAVNLVGLRRDTHSRCGCIGDYSNGTLGAKTLTRGALMTIASLAVYAGGSPQAGLSGALCGLALASCLRLRARAAYPA